MEGKQHGPWVEHFSGFGTVDGNIYWASGDGSIRVGRRTCIREGLYVGGKRDGNWVGRCKFVDRLEQRRKALMSRGSDMGIDVDRIA